MLSLSKKADYAIIAAAGLLSAGREGASSRQLAERFHLPLPLLRNILKNLAQAGIVSSTRGSAGGYRLECSPDEISVADVVAAVDGPWRLTACCGECTDAMRREVDGGAARGSTSRSVGVGRDVGVLGGGACELETMCPVKRPVQRLHACFEQVLARITLADVVFDRIPQTVVIRREHGHSGSTATPPAMEVMSA